MPSDLVDYIVLEYITIDVRRVIFNKNVTINELSNLNSLASRYFNPYSYYIFNKYKKRKCWRNN